MKKIAILSMFAFVSLINAQGTITSGLLPTDMGVINKINSLNSNRALNYDEIQGSPYPNTSFILAKFNNNYEMAPARYNSYTDEIEYQKNNQTFTLPKTDVFSKIILISSKDVLVRLDTKDDLAGYFYELINGKYSLYKKIKTEFIDSIPTKSSYDSEKPAEFKTLPAIYYIKTDNGIIKKNKNLKDILEFFPEKKESIEAFYKSNKLKLNKEENLIKLVNFLNQ